MTNAVTATELRQRVYRLLDHVLETGEPLEVIRKGRRLRVVPDEPGDLLARITPLPGLIAGDPEALVSADWSGQWDADRALNP
ncbi:MAG: hypothetical protein QM679_01415 [Patulibacter sp.]